MQKILNIFEKCSAYSLVLLRVTLGIIFMVHGYQKVLDPAMVIKMVGGIGFPLPEVFAWLLILTELVGGIFLILGLFTRIFAAGLTFAMLVAIFAVHLKNGLVGQGGYEYVLTLCMALIVTMTFGARKFSLDQLIFKGKI